MTDEIGRFEAVVRGRVQGVGFRYFVLRRANALGLAGWVANDPDGSVRCVAEGPEAALKVLADALHEGPPGARVGDVAVNRLPPSGARTGFSVRASAHRGD